MIENMSYGTKPNKTLGQHFLSNTAVLKSIVEAVQIAPRDMVLEVGPGTGTLTDELLAAGARVIAVEKDGTLVAKLKEKYSDADKFYDFDGVRFEYQDWWANVRPSNTEPLLRLNVEAKTDELMEEKRDELLKIIRT